MFELANVLHYIAWAAPYVQAATTALISASAVTSEHRRLQARDFIGECHAEVIPADKQWVLAVEGSCDTSIPAVQTLVLVQEDTKAAQVASEILSNTPCRVLVVFGEPSAACLKTAFELANAHAQIVVAAASRIEHMAFLSRKTP